MSYPIHPVLPQDYPEIIAVWEASVRATHHFLDEADLLFYKKSIQEEYLPSGMILLFCIKENNGAILGFTGLSETMIEMLFIRPDARGKGIGDCLLRYAVEVQQKNKVDVNEQNMQAVGFYKHFGFQIEGRSPFDGAGKPYPILHMKLPG